MTTSYDVLLRNKLQNIARPNVAFLSEYDRNFKIVFDEFKKTYTIF